LLIIEFHINALLSKEINGELRGCMCVSHLDIADTGGFAKEMKKKLI